MADAGQPESNAGAAAPATVFTAIVLQPMCAALVPATAFGCSIAVPSVHPNEAFDVFIDAARTLDKGRKCPLDMDCIVCGKLCLKKETPLSDILPYMVCASFSRSNHLSEADVKAKRFAYPAHFLLIGVACKQNDCREAGMLVVQRTFENVMVGIAPFWFCGECDKLLMAMRDDIYKCRATPCPMASDGGDNPCLHTAYCSPEHAAKHAIRATKPHDSVCSRCGRTGVQFKQCANCGKMACEECDSEKALKLHCCTGCETTFYCGEKCQAAHWTAGHREACRQAQKKKKKKSPSE